MCPHDLVPVILGHLEQQIIPGNSGIIHQNSYGTPNARNLLHHGRHGMRVGDIDSIGHGLSPVFPDCSGCGLSLLLKEINDGDMHPFLGQAQCFGPADSFRRSRNDGNTSFQLCVHDIPP